MITDEKVIWVTERSWYSDLKIEYKDPIAISKTQWKEILLDSNIFKITDIELILRIYTHPNFMATASELADEAGGLHPSSYNMPVVTLSKRICKSLNINPPKNKHGEYRWWHVAFWAKRKSSGHFYWILRPELKDAIDDLIKENKIFLPNTMISEIRIIPMNKATEFDNMSFEEVQHDYFLNNLKNRDNCLYFYLKSGINCKNNCLLLFQYDNSIIASAIMKDQIKYDPPRDGVSYGAFSLFKDSIQVFDPISARELQLIDNNFHRFSRAKQSMDIKSLNRLLALITAKKNSTTLPEEILFEEAEKLKEGAKKQIIVNAYERNSQARKKCIEHYGPTCQICGFNFSAFYGPEFEGKIHVHHLKPLNELDEEYEINPITDLISICPNCHLVVHSRNPVYTPEEIRKILGK